MKALKLSIALLTVIGTATSALAQTSGNSTGAPGSTTANPPAATTPMAPPASKQMPAGPGVGTRPMGPPLAPQTETNPNDPGANLKKLDKQGKGGQEN